MLQLIIFDEAHYSATSQPNEGKRDTPYENLLNFLNSEEYPNVVVLLVTATPWNLLTVSSKLERSTEVILNAKKEVLPLDNSISKDSYKRIPLHEITWNHGYEGTFIAGKKTKLMVSYIFTVEKLNQIILFYFRRS